MKVVYGDLLTMAENGEFDVIVHGCNCFLAMGGGIARQIRDKWPQAATADNETIRGDKTKLGTYTSTTASCAGPKHGFFIINAYTQYGWTGMNGYTGDVFEYDAFEKILKSFSDFKIKGQKTPAHFGFPLIGCGLAGGNEERILKMIDTHIPNATVVKWKMIND